MAAIHLGLDHERLQAQALAQLADLRESGRRLLDAGDAERRALERDLHDGAQQRLVALSLGMRVLRSRGGSGESLDLAERQVQEAVVRCERSAAGSTRSCWTMPDWVPPCAHSPRRAISAWE